MRIYYECMKKSVVCASVRNGYSLFCKKYFHEHSTSAKTMKDASAVWHQLSPAKKRRYQKKASKVYHIFTQR